MDKKPNLLFVITDDQRFDTIAALGNKDVKTPNLDEIVRNGTSFVQAHMPGGSTHPVCMPSRAMIHTGKTLFRWEDHGETIPKDHVLLGEVLRREGYRTFAVGKWHNGTESFTRSFEDGGNIFFSGMWDHWNVPVCDYDPTGAYDNVKNFISNPFYESAVTRLHCDRIVPGKHSSELFGETAVKWLESYDREDPFFLYLAFMAPHDPKSCPDEFIEMYDPDSIHLPDNLAEAHPFNFSMQYHRDEVLAPYPRTPEIVRKHMAEYYAMISHMDHQLGKVIDTLKRKGKYENTIIVFVSDHGIAMGQHGLFGKQNTYDHSIRIPLIFAGPGIPKNEIRDTYVYHFDIFPTLCDLIGVQIPASLEAKSLMPALKDDKVQMRDSLYFAYADVIRGTKDRRYKLIEYRWKDVRVTQLFDLYEDPQETNNLFGKPGYQKVTSQLRERLLRYKEEWNDDRDETGKVFWSNY